MEPNIYNRHVHCPNDVIAGCSMYLNLPTFNRKQISRKVEEDDFDDFTANQKWVMSPKAHDTDVTLLLNKLLKEYDKKLRPDIG
ncbi:hypothetical protein E2320_004677, partial [Naja naja]